jgi:hypothetical protein
MWRDIRELTAGMTLRDFVRDVLTARPLPGFPSRRQIPLILGFLALGVVLLVALYDEPPLIGALAFALSVSPIWVMFLNHETGGLLARMWREKRLS